MDTDSVVVDSSVWIDSFADVSSPQVRELKKVDVFRRRLQVDGLQRERRAGIRASLPGS